GSPDRARRRRIGGGRRRRLDRPARRGERHRDHGRHPARKPLRQGGRAGDRAERQAVHGRLDRYDARHAQPDARPALGRRGHGRAAAVLAARPLGLPRCARPGDPATAARRAGLIMAPPPLIQLKDIALTFGGTPLLEGVELSVSAGERVALVGRNGSGKSTLLKIAAGLVEPDRGSRFLQPGATVRYLPQEPDFAGAANVLDYVEAGL